MTTSNVMIDFVGRNVYYTNNQEIAIDKVLPASIQKSPSMSSTDEYLNEFIDEFGNDCDDRSSHASSSINMYLSTPSSHISESSIDEVWSISRQTFHQTTSCMSTFIISKNQQHYFVKEQVKSGLLDCPGMMKSLKQEIKILTSLNHRNIVKIIGKEEDNEVIRMIMPCLDGGDLQDRLSQSIGSTMSEMDAKIVIRQVLDGVAYLHSNNIIHRDIKPENILFHNKIQLDLVICDFDLAVQVEGPNQQFFTPVGTNGYLPAEMYNGTSYSFPVDCWTIGVMLFEILFDTLPFSNNDSIYENHFWKNLLTNDCQNFITGLLQPIPSNRMTAVQALHHPWLKD